MSLARVVLSLLLLLACRAVAAQPCAAVAVLVDLPVQEAWARLSDFSLAHNYVPGLTRTEIVSARRQGVGAHRRVYQSDGDFLEETVIEWNEGRGFVIRLHEGDEPMAPFERAQFSYQLEAAGAERTRVDLALRVVMPWGAPGKALGEWIIAPLLARELVQVAAGLKYFYESGQPATDDDRERLAAEVQSAEC